MNLADRTWLALGEYFESESLALVPLGSTEQHGPHLQAVQAECLGAVRKSPISVITRISDSRTT